MSGNEHTLTCPKCKTNNKVRGKAMTLAMTCTNCNKYFRRGGWNKEVTTFGSKYDQAIPLGAKGRIDGTLYEVMGFAIKKETKYKYTWREYLLYNPYFGYCFLSEYNGHWNIVWSLENELHTNFADSDINFENNTYRLYQKYQAEVIYANGEFFFDVVDITGSTNNWEYISPPFLIALETSEDSELWCQGEYLTPDEVAKAFKISVSKLPEKTGIGYTQPIATSFSERSLIILSVFLGLTLIFIQIFFNRMAEEKVVYKGGFNQSALTDQKFFVTPTFNLEGGTKSIDILVQAPVSNDWFFGEFSLINEDTGEEINFTKDIEYYSGYEGGESWSEGSSQAEAFISRVPEGRYHLNIYPEFSTNTHEFYVEVRRGIATNSNFWITLFGLSLFPGGYYARKRYLEGKRWSDSDYSPYDSD